MAKEIPIPFPIKGTHKGTAYNNVPEGYTTDSLNVVSYDHGGERGRGGQRDGTGKWFATAINGSNPVHAMCGMTRLAADVFNSEILWLATSTNANPHGVVHHPTGNDVFFTTSDSSAYQVSRFSQSGTRIWEAQFGTGNSTHRLYISGDGSLLFMNNNNAGQNDIQVISAIDGSSVNSVNSSATSNTADMHVVRIGATDVYRIAVADSQTTHEVYITDYDTVADTFTTVWNPGITADLGINQGAELMSVHIDPTDTDVIYVGMTRNGDSESLLKINASSKTLIWAFDAVPQAAKGVRTIDSDGAGTLYCGLDRATAPSTHNVVKVVDAGTSASIPASNSRLDNGETFVFRVRYLSDDQIYVGAATGAGTTTNGITRFSSDMVAEANITITGSDGTHDLVVKPGFPDIVYFGGATLSQFGKAQFGRSGELTRNKYTVAISGGNSYSITYNLSTNQLEKSAALGTGVHSTGLFKNQCVQYSGKIYTVDGTVGSSTGYRIIDPVAGTDVSWVTSMTSGSLPVSSANGPRIIERYRGRIFLSGIIGDDQNGHFLKLDDPLNNDLSAIVNGTEAVTMNTGDLGVIGLPIMGAIPHSDDVMIIGTSDTIHILRGDPSPISGGRSDLVTESLGMWFGRAWANAPNGVAYFIGSDSDVYRMLISGDQVTRPESISDFRISNVLNMHDPRTVRAMLAWDNQRKGLHLFLTPHSAIAAEHWFWSARTDAWWPIKYPIDFGPTSVIQFDSDNVDERGILMGGRDSIIRFPDRNSSTDDGTAISSHVAFTPMRLTGEDHEMMIRKLSLTLGSNTDSVDYQVRVGKDAESAISATASYSGTLTGGGRKPSIRSRARGNAAVIRLSNNTNNSSWSYESGSATVEPKGLVRV